MHGDEEHLRWFMRWWAAILQKPTKRTDVCILIRGEQGCGKSTVTEFFANKVFGAANMSVIQNAALDLFSRFSNAAIDKSVVLLDEPENLNNLITKLKFMITSGVTRKELKGIDVTQTPNYSNLVITCNDRRILRMEHRQRRYALFECDDRYVGNTAYFNDLRAHLEKPSVARSMYARFHVLLLAEAH